MDSSDGELLDSAQSGVNLAVEEATEGASFVGLRLASNALWIGGTALSYVAQEKLGVPWAVAGASVATGVTAIEYKGTGLAHKIFQPQERVAYELPTNPTRLQRFRNMSSLVLRETITSGYALWAGAMSGVEVNNIFDIKNTETRRRVQSTLYGVGVGAWSLPFVKDNVASEAFESLQNNPAETIGVGAIGGFALWGALKGTRSIVDRFHNKRVKRLGLSEE